MLTPYLDQVVCSKSPHQSSGSTIGHIVRLPLIIPPVATGARRRHVGPETGGCESCSASGPRHLQWRQKCSGSISGSLMRSICVTPFASPTMMTIVPKVGASAFQVLLCGHECFRHVQEDGRDNGIHHLDFPRCPSILEREIEDLFRCRCASGKPFYSTPFSRITTS